MLNTSPQFNSGRPTGLIPAPTQAGSAQERLLTLAASQKGPNGPFPQLDSPILTLYTLPTSFPISRVSIIKISPSISLAYISGLPIVDTHAHHSRPLKLSYTLYQPSSAEILMLFSQQYHLILLPSPRLHYYLLTHTKCSCILLIGVFKIYDSINSNPLKSYKPP